MVEGFVDLYCSHQQNIMSLYISLGQPGGGARRHPLCTTCIAYIQVTLEDTQHVIHMYLNICVSLERFVSETPYLIHETPKTPHITGCRVLLVVESL